MCVDTRVSLRTPALNGRLMDDVEAGNDRHKHIKAHINQPGGIHRHRGTSLAPSGFILMGITDNHEQSTSHLLTH